MSVLPVDTLETADQVNENLAPALLAQAMKVTAKWARRNQ